MGPDEKRQIRQAILKLVDERGRGKSICPSEVARKLYGDLWRSRMEDIRTAAAELAQEGEITITQKGVVCDPQSSRGPIRLRRREDMPPDE